MAAIASKRKLNAKSTKDKYQALKEVEESKSKLQVAAKYGIPKNTLSTWIKNKDKIFEAATKGMNTKRQRLRAGSYEKLDQAIFKWLLTVWSRDVAVSGLILKHPCPQQTLRFIKNGHFQIFVFQKVWYIEVTK